ncbi:MAG: alpha/beta fold hydrolase [candidate division KSB1 bacterium]|nr:alpha/beta fold hydrolase [candidate division KSB1 bacterium]MDZ7369317.1 alpha/beta fold hydrolase [candidate division KSB1 bacterium]MDZ7407337.1 alpha/beta fold hydrolase [candidate division KSB1 bacterium]
MNKIRALLMGGIMAMSPLTAFPQQGLEGIWQGVLKVQSLELRIVFNISKTPEGKFTATLDSPDQGATGIPVSAVTFENGNVKIEVKSIFGVFDGKLESDQTTITGEWKQGAAALPLVLKRTDKAPELPRRPQEPQKPYPYHEEEVVYDNRQAGIKLVGTLTLPQSGEPFPAVILITGSGPQNRDEALLGHRPFLILADALTRRGVAVLRFDDRGVGKSTGEFAKATSADFATDVIAGIEYLKTRREINPKQIGLIGHSEGGLIAPMVAAQTSDVAFIVMMAGPGITGAEILDLQGALIAKANGASEAVIAKNRDLQKKMFAVVKAEKDDAVAEKKLRPIWTEALQALTDEEKKALDFSGANPDSLFQIQIKQLLSPWFRHFLFYDPQPTLKKVKCPVLAINGEKDLQVPPKENLSAIEKALKAGGNKNFTVTELPGLNHLFQTATTGSPAEYAKIEETISPAALQMMGDWILAQVKSK